MLASVYPQGGLQHTGSPEEAKNTVDSLYRSVYINESLPSPLRQTLAKVHALATDGFDLVRDSLYGESSSGTVRDRLEEPDILRDPHILEFGQLSDDCTLASVHQKGLDIWAIDNDHIPHRLAAVSSDRLQVAIASEIQQIIASPCRLKCPSRSLQERHGQIVSVLSRSRGRSRVGHFCMNDELYPGLAGDSTSSPIALQHSQTLTGLLFKVSESAARLDVYHRGSPRLQFSVDNVIPYPSAFTLADDRLAVQVICPQTRTGLAQLGRQLSGSLQRTCDGVNDRGWAKVNSWRRPDSVRSTEPNAEARSSITPLVNVPVRTQITAICRDERSVIMRDTTVLDVSHCAFLQLSPDRRLLAVAELSRNGRDLLIYDVSWSDVETSPKLLCRLVRGHSPCMFTAIRWREDSRWIGVATNHGTVHIWCLDIDQLRSEDGSARIVPALEPSARLKVPGQCTEQRGLPFSFAPLSSDEKDQATAGLYPPWRRHAISVRLLDLARGTMVIYQVEDTTQDTSNPGARRTTRPPPKGDGKISAIVGISVLSISYATSVAQSLEERMQSAVKEYSTACQGATLGGMRAPRHVLDEQRAWATIPSLSNRPSLASYFSRPLAVPNKPRRRPASTNEDVQLTSDTILTPGSNSSLSLDALKVHPLTERLSSVFLNAGTTALDNLRHVDADRRLRWYGQGRDQQGLLTSLRTRLGRENGICGMEVPDADAFAPWDIEISSDEEGVAVNQGDEGNDLSLAQTVEEAVTEQHLSDLPMSGYLLPVAIPAPHAYSPQADESDLDSSPTRAIFQPLSSSPKAAPMDLTPPSSVPRSEEDVQGLEDFLKKGVPLIKVTSDSKTTAEEKVMGEARETMEDECNVSFSGSRHFTSEEGSEHSHTPAVPIRRKGKTSNGSRRKSKKSVR